MLPGSRVLLGWWRELASLRPQRLWFAHLLLHHVEALAAVARLQPLDPVQAALLQALDLPAPGGCQENGDPAHSPLARLRLDRQVLARLLHALAGAGLARPAERGRWELTDAGRLAHRAGAFLTRTRERRAFYFVNESPVQRPPHFLALDRPPAAPLAPPEGWRFDAGLLEECVHQTPEWKRRFRFPAEVESVLGASAAGAAPDWQHVILDRPEQLFLVLVETAEAGGPSLLGFGVREEGWVLERAAPVLALAEGGEEVFPDLAAQPPEEAWRRAWASWCQPRGLPPDEVEACRLEPAGHRLVVHAPPRLVDRLRAARSDAVKHEAWLLAGAGRVREAAQVELIEAPR
jgi:hypothetical protein